MSVLVLVESPTKVKTITKYLPKGYRVAATYGHIRDLPKSSLGVDVENNYKADYEVAATKKKRLTALRKAAKGVDEVLIAVDPDREGEAIGWHTGILLGLLTEKGNVKKGLKVSRIAFHEITKSAILDSLKHRRGIDMDLVNAQQTRRILDRLVGYKLSPLLWQKIRYGLSAGRVQSVALRLIVEKEVLREKFIPEEYWSLSSHCSLKKTGNLKIEYIEKDGKKNELPNDLVIFNLYSQKGKKVNLKKKDEVKTVVEFVKDKPWKITGIKERKSKRKPFSPFITSTLQQASINKFGFTSKRTMMIAQKLYEAGHITYMRTDSTNLSQEAISEIRKLVTKRWGKENLEEKIRVYSKKSKNAQEAHEAIRPTHVSQTSATLKLADEQKKIYDLIWQRTIATQMKDAIIGGYTVEIKLGDYLFKASFQKVLFKGFMNVYDLKMEEQEFPKFKIGDVVFPEALMALQHFTQPPARYSEASLIKELEKHGIGRPSTYASIISTIMSRGYVEKEQRYLFPTDTGRVVNSLLVDNFENIVDVEFTAKLENQLDEIAKGKMDWYTMLDEFYKPFEKNLEKKKKTLKKKEYTVLGKSDEKCPDCGGKMIIKLGKYGKFLSCAKFPECKGMKSLEEKEGGEMDTTTEEFVKKYKKAPKTDDKRNYELKRGRYGLFWAHPDYPKVKDARPLLLKEKCPDCGKPLTERMGKWKRKFIGCSGYPDCKYIKKTPKKKEE